jgi:RNA polymerase sigma-70 factor (ECF subfamily)
MGPDPNASDDLVTRAASGGEAALAALRGRQRGYLRPMVRPRLDRGLPGRVGPSDAADQADLDLAARLPDSAGDRPMPPFLWLRLVTGQRLMHAYHTKRGAARRCAGRAVGLHPGPLPQASSASLAARLLGRLTIPSQAAVGAGRQLRLQEVRNGMDPTDREIPALRRFEEPSNGEAAEALGLSRTAANNRYVRALGRLRDLLGRVPGSFEGG